MASATINGNAKTSAHLAEKQYCERKSARGRQKLKKACEAYDRSEQAREAIAKHGMTYSDRFGAPRARPECAIERDSRLAFYRICRELGLDIVPPAESRPPALRATADADKKAKSYKARRT